MADEASESSVPAPKKAFRAVFMGTPAPAECPSSLVVHASLELTAASYSVIYHVENCPDLSR